MASSRRKPCSGSTRRSGAAWGCKRDKTLRESPCALEHRIGRQLTGPYQLGLSATPSIVHCAYNRLRNSQFSRTAGEAMIRSFQDKDTERLWHRIRSRKFQAIEKPARIKLALLDSAATLKDLGLPGLGLEKLKGDRKGQYSIRINDQFRICFGWRDNGAEDVTITDYH